MFTNAYKPITSGVVNTIEIIMNALERKGHEVFVFAPDFTGYKDDKKNIIRYPSVNLIKSVKFPVAIPLSYYAGQVLKKFKPDIIHAHQPFVLGKAGLLYSRKHDIPFVLTYHTQYEMYTHYIPLPQNLVKYFCRRSIRNVLDRTTCITTPSPSIAEMLESYGLKTRIEVIPNAVNLDEYHDVSDNQLDDIKRLYELEGKRVVLYVGRIAPEKNLIFLIDSFKRVYEKISNAMLMIVGDGPQLSELKRYVSNIGFDSRIIFTGNVEYKKIPAYYMVSDIFAITSTTEVKPLVILEALAAGLPIVAVYAPGAKDTLTDDSDGILTKESLDEYSNALIKLLTDDLLYQRLSKGAVKTSVLYSADHISDCFISLYKELSN